MALNTANRRTMNRVAKPASAAAQADARAAIAGLVYGDVQQVPVDEIFQNPDQPRKEFVREELESMAASIREHGVLQPIILRRTALGLVILAGERRWRGAKIAELKTIPATIRTVTDSQNLVLALVENLQRAELTPLEQANGVKALHDENPHWTVKELGAQLGHTEDWASAQLAAANASEDVKTLLQYPKSFYAVRLIEPIKEQPLRSNLINTWRTRRISTRELGDMIKAERAKYAPPSKPVDESALNPNAPELPPNIGITVHRRPGSPLTNDDWREEENRTTEPPARPSAPKVNHAAVPATVKRIVDEARTLEGYALQFHESGPWADEVKRDMHNEIDEAISLLSRVQELLPAMGIGSGKSSPGRSKSDTFDDE